MIRFGSVVEFTSPVYGRCNGTVASHRENRAGYVRVIVDEEHLRHRLTREDREHGLLVRAASLTELYYDFDFVQQSTINAMMRQRSKS